MNDLDTYHITGTTRCCTDGASRGNPGASSYAFIVVSDGKLLHEESAYIGTATNNIAEYRAVISALTWIAGITRGPVEVYSDSELVMRQLSGVYSVKQPHLLELYRSVKLLESSFQSVTYAAVPREHPGIRRADELCNSALDLALQRK